MSSPYNPAEFHEAPSVVSDGGNFSLPRADRIALLAGPVPITPVTAETVPVEMYDSQAPTIMASRFPRQDNCDRSGLRYPLQPGECDPRGPYPLPTDGPPANPPAPRPAEGIPANPPAPRPVETPPADSTPPTPRPVYPPPFYETPGTQGMPISRPGVPRDGSVPIGPPGVPRDGSVPIGPPGVPRGGKTPEPGIKIQQGDTTRVDPPIGTPPNRPR